jgi:cytochrome P450
VTTAAPAIDFENDAFARSVPYEMFDWLRRNDPVRWYDWPHGRGYWAVTRHDDLVAIHKDTETYSSETGATALEDLEPDAIEARKSMIDTDPPHHTRLRALVNRGFTPRAVSAYEELLRELTRAILDEALPLGEFDFIEHVAAPLPIQVLCRILGVPPEDNQLLIDWGDRMIGSTDPTMSDISYEDPESERYRLLPFRSPAAVELWKYGHGIAEARRGDPRDDLVTKLVEAEIDGERLTSREFDVMFLLLVVAGNETTRQ